MKKGVYMELTREEFEQILDKKISNLATKDSLINLATKDSLLGLATKDDLAKQTAELKKFAEEQTEQLARIIAVSVVEPMDEGFRIINKKIDALNPRVDKLEHEMKGLKSALSLS
jgi:prefoldin subunit 5